MVTFAYCGEEFEAELRVGAIRAGSVFFVSQGGVLLVRAVWDLARESAVNASLTAAGAAVLTLDEAAALVFTAEKAMVDARPCRSAREEYVHPDISVGGSRCDQLSLP